MGIPSPKKLKKDREEAESAAASAKEQRLSDFADTMAESARKIEATKEGSPADKALSRRRDVLQRAYEKAEKARSNK